MSMAVSLELRAPFVDHRMVEAIAPIPTMFKVSNGRKKPLLVDALNDPLVAAASVRPKQGFPFPLRRWLQEELDPNEISSTDLGFDPGQTRRIFARGKHGIAHLQAWALIVIGTWMRDNHLRLTA